jgi:SAM-dependent methyltransferase
LAQSHVDMANQRISALQLENIKIVAGDITKMKFEPGAFDFILCHGVFSWVPPAAQQAIFRICAESLSPKGLASISFNVLPGWHMRRVVRDICLTHAGTSGTPQQRVTRARNAVQEIAKGLTGTDPYTVTLRSEAERLRTKPSAYVMGEFLSEHNTPIYFNDFRTRAAAAGLDYLCDGEIATSLPEYLAPRAKDKIVGLAMGRAETVQHYTDVITGRTFRRAVLVRNGRIPAALRAIDPARLRRLHFSAELTANPAAADGSGSTFKDARGRQLSPGDPRATAMLTRLASAFPATLTVEDILGEGADDPALVASVLKTLLGMIGRQQASVFALPLKVGRDGSERPRAWKVARLDALAKQPWASSLHHRAALLTPVLSMLLPLMDGTRDRAAFREALALALAKGEVKPARRLNGANGAAAPAEAELSAALAYAVRNGLMES